MVASPHVMSYAGRFAFPVTPAELWGAIGRFDQFERWWSWLGNLKIEGDGLQAGSRLIGTVAPPVPYRMRVIVELEKCEQGQSVDASISGDLAGPAHLRLFPTETGTDAEIAWDLEMRQLPMRVAARVAYPLLRWGHDQVVEATVNGFRRQLVQESRSR
jgi:carbon monoxide dehydrogenase subunit G